jgi:hypothetical protein
MDTVMWLVGWIAFGACAIVGIWFCLFFARWVLSVLLLVFLEILDEFFDRPDA